MTDGGNPVRTLVSTFALMSLFAVGGANAAIPEIQRIAVDVHHWMDAKQFADIYALSQLSPGPERADRHSHWLHGGGCRGRARRDLCDVRADCGPCLLCKRLPLARKRASRWPAIIQTALVPLSIGLMGARALILAETTDRSVAAALITAVVAVLAFATRLNPLWMFLAGGILGFAGLI